MYQFSTHSAIADIPAAQWNRLVDPDTPFLRHEFLAAMESEGCVGEALGWIPMHLALRDAGGRLVAAAPAYLKFNSYGEFVFDWSWAEAYQRHGQAYYPKLVVASPYTPATGPRVLVGQGPEASIHASALARQATQLTERLGVSSLHWLFTSASETQMLTGQGLLRRMGCQFHWHNAGYGSFEDFLGTFSAEKRKKIKRERRRVRDNDLHLRPISGAEATEEQWSVFHQLYCDTFDRRGGIPTLSLGFFQRIAETLGDRLLLVLAYQGQRIVAAAFSLVGERSLYGRHWGCFEDFHSLHFEACYYQGLDYCIERGLARFEPGAQGEHKISRGFLPTATWSAHWIADPRFREAIARFVHTESGGVEHYMRELATHSPYREPPAPPLIQVASDLRLVV